MKQQDLTPKSGLSRERLETLTLLWATNRAAGGDGGRIAAALCLDSSLGGVLDRALAGQALRGRVVQAIDGGWWLTDQGQAELRAELE